jgi:hypothetical protein
MATEVSLTFRSASKTFTLPENTILYRLARTVEKKPKLRTCCDTDKKGVYLSNTRLIPLMMMYEFVEHGEGSIHYLCTYRLKTETIAGIGKYSNEKVASHIEHGLTPIITKKYMHWGQFAVYPKVSDSCYEVFICHNNLELVHSEKIVYCEELWDNIKKICPFDIMS